jgi:hypothetical protein
MEMRQKTTTYSNIHRNAKEEKQFFNVNYASTKKFKRELYFYY